MTNFLNFQLTSMLTASESATTHREVPVGDVIGGGDPASCPLALAVNTIGGRWKLHILRSLLLSGPARYSELLSAIDGISSKELTRNLRELETADLVQHVSSREYPTYQLTPLGTEIEASFRALGIFEAALVKRRRPRI